MSFYSTHIVSKSGKRHTCEYCGGKIEQGEEYQQASGMCEGEFWHCKLHPECVAAGQEYCRQYSFDDGWAPGEQARGRVDDDRSRPTQFKPDGTRTEEPLNPSLFGCA